MVAYRQTRLDVVTGLTAVMLTLSSAGTAAADTITLLLGDVDGGVYNGPGSVDDIPLDPQWVADVAEQWAGIENLDFARVNQAVPFTFTFDLPPDHVVMEATLTTGLRSLGGHPLTDFLLLDTTVVSELLSFRNLGWEDTPTDRVVERRIDLARALGRDLRPLLADGVLNGVYLDDHLVDYVELTMRTGIYGDLDDDDFVGANDLSILIENWNRFVAPNDSSSGDVTGDGFVGLDDLSWLIVNWNVGVLPQDAAVAAVPEPASVVCPLPLVVPLLRRPCTKRRQTGPPVGTP